MIDDGDVLLHRLETVYADTQGSMRPLLTEIVKSDAFWSEHSRWSLIKSPVQLAVGACRQFELASPPVAALDFRGIYADVLTSWLRRDTLRGGPAIR